MYEQPILPQIYADKRQMRHCGDMPFMLFIVYLRESALSAREYSHKHTQAIAKRNPNVSRRLRR